MLRAYLDDTGGDGFLGFGGFAGKAEAWDALEAAWIEHNLQHQINWFHAKHYPELVRDYSELALRFNVYLLGFTVDVAAYKEYARKRIRNDFGINEFASAASGCASNIFDWVLHWSQDEQCALFIDCKPEFAGSITDAINFEVSKRVRDGARNPLLSLTTITDSDKRRTIPLLQVADLGANLSSKHTAARYYGLRSENDLSDLFFNKRHWMGITHCPPDNIEKMADIFTDPQWRRFFE